MGIHLVGDHAIPVVPAANSSPVINKTIVDYTSPALCTPVAPFPAIGDAAYRQPARGGPSHGHRQHAQKFGKDRMCGSGDILTNRQTQRYTHHKFTILVTMAAC